MRCEGLRGVDEGSGVVEGLDGPERLILERRPALRSVVVMGLWRLVGLGAIAGAGVWLVVTGLAPVLGQWAVGGAVVVALVLLSWLSLVRDAMRLRLTDRRISVRSGVFNVVSADAPLEQVTNVLVVRTLTQRVFGLGTIGALTASDAGTIAWMHVDDCAELAARINQVIDEAKAHRLRVGQAGRVGGGEVGGGNGSMTGTMMPERTNTVPADESSAADEMGSPRLPVLGVVGGIGAGKSTVARAFAELGCHVIDSDQRARAALDREDVRERLVSWWGVGILAADGRVDRSKVAAIVFSDAKERSRLEAEVHPIVRQERAAMIREAKAARAAGVIVDAPLLFEAGVDAECDAVVFVEAPASVRLARVQASRGWSGEELERRERAQMGLEEKRARCRYVIENSGPAERSLVEQARGVLDDARSRWAAPGVVEE